MAHVDYESAWHDLVRRLGDKPGWGTGQLRDLMAQVAAEHEIPEDLLQRALRLYGGSLTIQIVPETGAASEDGSSAPAKSPDPGPSIADERSDDEQHSTGGSEDSPERGAGRADPVLAGRA